jgi:hypothetical protein
MNMGAAAAIERNINLTALQAIETTIMWPKPSHAFAITLDNAALSASLRMTGSPVSGEAIPAPRPICDVWHIAFAHLRDD